MGKNYNILEVFDGVRLCSSDCTWKYFARTEAAGYIWY